MDFAQHCCSPYNQDTYKGRAIYVRCVAEPLAEVRAHGTVVVGRRWKNLGSQLDLRTRAIAKAIQRQNKFKQGYEGKRTRQTNLRRR